jgi:hypothetical protein
LLEIAEDANVAIQLEAPDLNPTEKPHIGFYVAKAQDKEKKVILSASEIVGDCKYAAKPAGRINDNFSLVFIFSSLFKSFLKSG